MPIEIHELTIRLVVTDPPAGATPDWEAALQQAKQEILEQCQETVRAQLQHASER